MIQERVAGALGDMICLRIVPYGKVIGLGENLTNYLVALADPKLARRPREFLDQECHRLLLRAATHNHRLLEGELDPSSTTVFSAIVLEVFVPLADPEDHCTASLIFAVHDQRSVLRQLGESTPERRLRVVEVPRVENQHDDNDSEYHQHDSAP